MKRDLDKTLPNKDIGHKKVLLVLYYYLPYISGVSVYAQQVAEGLHNSGYEVTILTSRHDKTLPKEETLNGVKIIRRPVLFKLNKGVIMPLFWLDIIRFAHMNDYVNPHLPLAESGVASLFIPKKKIVTTYQCDVNLGEGLLSKTITSVSLTLMRLQLMRSRAVAVLSKDYIDHSKMQKFSGKAVAINPPIAIDLYKPIPSDKFFTGLGVRGKTLKIGFMGRIVYEKGIDYLLATIPYLQKTLKDFKIIVAGDYENVAGGSIKDTLDSFIQKYPDTIVFTGFLSQKEKQQFYSGIDVFVLPSIDPLEAFGMVQVEAMLCGAPVVASDMPGVRVPVQLSGCGLLAKPRNAKDLAKKITIVIEDRKKYQPVRKEIVSIFDPQKTIEQYSRLMPR